MSFTELMSGRKKVKYFAIYTKKGRGKRKRRAKRKGTKLNLQGELAAS